MKPSNSQGSLLAPLYDKLNNSSTLQETLLKNDRTHISVESCTISDPPNTYSCRSTVKVRDRSHRQVLRILLKQLTPVDFYGVAELKEGERLTKKHYIVITINHLLKTAKARNWGLCINNGLVYLYNGCFWKVLSKPQTQNFLGKAALKLGVDKYDAQYHRFQKELFEQFVSAAFLPSPAEGKETIINLQNGTYDFAQSKLRDFNRNDFLTYQLPFAYDAMATAPLFQTYLYRVLPDKEQQSILAEYIGYLFVRQKDLKLEKVLVLYGLGANGKSVFFEIIRALLGSNNVSSYSLQCLTDASGYFRAKIKDKLCNYASDVSPHMDAAIFKQLVSGEPLDARLPYGEPFTMDNYAKLVFNTNELPKDVEHNEAFFRRFLIIHFGVTIPEKERDVELASKIIDHELPGVLNWILAGLTRVLANRCFTFSQAIEDVINDYKIASDTVQLFLGDVGYEKSSNATVMLKQLFDEYRQYCKEYGERAVENKSFSKRLRSLGFYFARNGSGNIVGTEKRFI